MVNLAVFVSGSGSDLQSVIDAVQDGRLRIKIGLVLGSKEGIYALERAKIANIETVVFSKKNFATLPDMFDAVIPYLQKKGITHILLAGYLSVLTPNIVRAYENKIINIHPSLIPAYCGNGFYGRKVHEAVISAKEKFSGATVHFVDEGTDTGAIIAQTRVAVSKTDTVETLSAKVLEAEHILLPQALADLFNDIA